MKSVVLSSGGLDSTVLLAHVLNTEGGDIVALSVDYGQKHRRELWSAFQVARYYGAVHEVVRLPPELFVGSAITKDELPIVRAPFQVSGLCTVVPGRNLVLVSLAVATAVRHGARSVYIAPTADDRVVYPDCRHEFVSAIDAASQEGYNITVLAPFVGLKKRDVVSRGRELSVPFDMTWSCYSPQGYDPNAPSSGSPCGACGACVIRKASLS